LRHTLISCVPGGLICSDRFVRPGSWRADYPDLGCQRLDRLTGSSRTAGWTGGGHAPWGNVAAGQDESTIVQFDEFPESPCARLGAGHDDDSRGGDLFTLAGPDVLERLGFQAGLAVPSAVRVRSRTSMSGRLQRVRRQPGMVAASDSPRMSSVTLGGEFGQVPGGLTG
jgi:hypothetical protein